MPSIVTSAGFVFCLARVQASGNGRWWLGAGVAAGLGLLSKFSAVPGRGRLVWLLADRDARRWLKTPWPWAGALLVALAIFVPNLLWQSQHHWETFAFQFGRVGTGHLTLRFLGEFLAAQFGLATPLIFVADGARAVAGHAPGQRPLAARRAGLGGAVLFPGAFAARPGAGQLAVFPLSGAGDPGRRCFRASTTAGAKRLVAQAFDDRGAAGGGAAAGRLCPGAVSAAGSAQGSAGALLGRDFAPIGEVAAALVKAHLAGAVLTTDYETTAWLRFYQPGFRWCRSNEPQRYPDAPAPRRPCCRAGCSIWRSFAATSISWCSSFSPIPAFPPRCRRRPASTCSIRWAGPKVPRSARCPEKRRHSRRDQQ